jgi:hypothetical protein
MAVQGSGLGKGPDPAMVDQTHYDARSGAAKRTQTSFPVKEGMKDQTQYSRVGPGMSPGGEPNPAYHFGPDAGSANPSGPASPADSETVKASWDMKGGMGQGVDPDIAGKVLGEAILSGASRLPAATSEQSGAGPKQPG